MGENDRFGGTLAGIKGMLVFLVRTFLEGVTMDGKVVAVWRS